MDRIRIKQCERLIKKASKSKPKIKSKDKITINKVKEGQIDIETLNDAINKLLESETFIYKTLPSRKIKGKDAQEFCNNLMFVKKKIEKILSDFDVIKTVEEEIPKEILIVTQNTRIKKRLQDIGVDPRQIIVAGVPLALEDMKEINPNIPEHALKNIEKRIKVIKNEISRKIKHFEKILVVVQKDKSGKLLAKRAKELYNAEVMFCEDPKDIDLHKLSKFWGG